MFLASEGGSESESETRNRSWVGVIATFETLANLSINGYHTSTPSSKGGDEGEGEGDGGGAVGREEGPEPVV